jgi:hypothetical protein
MKISDVETNADQQFGTRAFLQLAVPQTFQQTTTTLSVAGTTIPVVSEWTWGCGQNLVFNTLNSCLGIIGTNQATGELIGAHFSTNYGASDWPGALGNFLQTNSFTEVYTFGDSQQEWASFGVSLPPVIAGDANSKKWFFSLDPQGGIQVHHWS